MVTCPKCETAYDRKPTKCACGHRFDGYDDVPKIRKCAACGITQEDYRNKHRWADPERGLKPDEKPYPYRTELMPWLGKFYCDEHNPQFQRSLREMREFERDVSERRKATNGPANGAIKNPPVDALLDKLNWQTSREANR